MDFLYFYLPNNYNGGSHGNSRGRYCRIGCYFNQILLRIMRCCEFWVRAQNSLELLKEISQAWLGLIWTWRSALRNCMFESSCQKLSKPAAVMVLDMVIRVICSLLINFSLDHFFLVLERGLNSSDVLQCWTGMKLARVIELHSIGYPANAREL